jgi:antitoxin component YwqK of YwqJK toxin-antitoxin module
MKTIFLTFCIITLTSKCYTQHFEKIIAFNDTFLILPKPLGWTKFMAVFEKDSIVTLPDGKWFWNSGSNKYYFSLKNNLVNGTFIRTDSTQNILETGSFKEGTQHGFFKYYIDGYLGSTRLFDFGSAREEILYCKNGFLKRKVLTVKVSKGENLNLCTFYHETGFISSQGYMGLNGKTGLWEYFDPAGNKLMEEIYKDGKLVSKESFTR